MIVSAIVAMSSNRVIGVNNHLPWSLPAEMKFFRKTTQGHHVLMGRKTFETLKAPLTNRINMVLTRDKHFAAPGFIPVFSLFDALYKAGQVSEKEMFVIGGAEVYRLALPIIDKLYLTEVLTHIPHGTTFFPSLDTRQWQLLSEEKHEADDKNEFQFTIRTYLRPPRSL